MGSGAIFGVKVCDFRNDLLTLAVNVSVLRYFKFDLVSCEFSGCWNVAFDLGGRFNWCIWWYEPEKIKSHILTSQIEQFNSKRLRFRSEFTFILCCHFGVTVLMIVHEFCHRILLLEFATRWSHTVSVRWAMAAATVCALSIVGATRHNRAPFNSARRHWLWTELRGRTTVRLMS